MTHRSNDAEQDEDEERGDCRLCLMSRSISSWVAT